MAKRDQHYRVLKFGGLAGGVVPQAGVVTREEIEALGIKPGDIDKMVASKDLEKVGEVDVPEPANTAEAPAQPAPEPKKADSK